MPTMASSPPWLVAVFFLGRVFIDTPVVSVHAFVSGDAITFAAAPSAARPPYALQSSLLAEPTDTQSIATHGSGGADIDDPGSFNDLTYKENVRISKLAEKSARGDRAVTLDRTTRRATTSEARPGPVEVSRFFGWLKHVLTCGFLHRTSCTVCIGRSVIQFFERGDRYKTCEQ